MNQNAYESFIASEGWEAIKDYLKQERIDLIDRLLGLVSKVKEGDSVVEIRIIGEKINFCEQIINLPLALVDTKPNAG